MKRKDHSTNTQKSIQLAMISVAAAVAFGCSTKPTQVVETTEPTLAEGALDLRFPGEKRFSGMRQLTFGGENAEAYFNADGTEIIFQSTREGFQCDQIFRMDVDGNNQRLVSTGEGRTTCAYIFPDQPKILYSSTHATLKTCPPRPDMTHGYVWPLVPDFEIYVAGPEGENPTVLAPHPGYDAEAVLAPTGDGIVFTSTRSGDIDIWFMNPDGTGIKQLTDEVGYDGGAFFSLDGQEIVYRANHPTDPQKLKDYQDLLAEDLVRPSVMDLRIMNRDGSNKRTILSNGAANFAPYFHPDGERIIFSSNMDDPGGRDFELYMINKDGTNLERITYNPSFDAFPMFSHDGTKVIFASNRNGSVEGETNVFVADWVEDVAPGIERELTGDAAIDPQTWQAIATQLADPALQGRGLGTPELEKAAELIAAKFDATRLEPAGDNGTYFQRFPASTSKQLTAATMSVGGKALTESQFRPFPFSTSGKGAGDAVFVGYGITSAQRDYDDYAGVDVAGKVAVAMRYEPQRDKADSAFDGTNPTRESDLRFKAINARHHGAAALVVINPPPLAGESDALYQFTGSPSDAGLPVIHVTWAAASKLFGAATLGRAYGTIESSGKPSSVDLGTKVAFDIAIESETAEVSNVVGRIRGNDSSRAIVLGAHYDHLGHGGEGSLSGETAPHLGADDNASGVASLVELAEALSHLEREVDIYFVAFTGEESGLLGSHWFVENLPVPREQIEAMLNFDMVGRLRNDQLTVLGTGTAKGLSAVVRRAQVGLPLDLRTSPDGYGPSDQMAFYARQIPVLHFFTGAHDDYHRPSDTADKLNAEGAATVTTFALRIAHELANAAHGKPYIAVRSSSAGDTGGDGSRGYGPYFGSIPAFGGESEKGVKISGARGGSPADKAGLKAGDVIVKFGEYDVTTLQDYAFALRQHKPGDTVTVVLMRDGAEVSVEAHLTEKSDDEAPAKSHHGHGEEGAKSPHGSTASPH